MKYYEPTQSQYFLLIPLIPYVHTSPFLFNKINRKSSGKISFKYHQNLNQYFFTLKYSLRKSNNYNQIVNPNHFILRKYWYWALCNI